MEFMICNDDCSYRGSITSSLMAHPLSPGSFRYVIRNPCSLPVADFVTKVGLLTYQPSRLRIYHFPGFLPNSSLQELAVIVERSVEISLKTHTFLSAYKSLFCQQIGLSYPKEKHYFVWFALKREDFSVILD